MSTRLGPAPTRRTPRLVVVILVIALVATPVLAFPYVLLDRSASRIDVQTDWAWVALVVHVPSAALAMILGALQFVPRIRARRPVHRAIGRTFLGLGTLAFVVTGIPLALSTPDGNITRFGVLIPAVLWPVVAVTAFRAIRGRRRGPPPGVDDPPLRHHVLRDHDPDDRPADAARAGAGDVELVRRRRAGRGLGEHPVRPVARLDRSTWRWPSGSSVVQNGRGWQAKPEAGGQSIACQPAVSPGARGNRQPPTPAPPTPAPQAKQGSGSWAGSGRCSRRTPPWRAGGVRRTGADRPRRSRPGPGASWWCRRAGPRP